MIRKAASIISNDVIGVAFCCRMLKRFKVVGAGINMLHKCEGMNKDSSHIFAMTGWVVGLGVL